MAREKEEKLRAERENREKEREEAPSSDSDKKEVIMIQTESSRRRGTDDVETNWRKRDDPPTNGSSIDNKTRHMGSGGRHMGRSKTTILLFLSEFTNF